MNRIIVTVGESPIFGDESAIVKNYQPYTANIPPLVSTGAADVILQILSVIADPTDTLIVQAYDPAFSDADHRPDEANDFCIS